MYDTQNYWASGLCPTSGILETRKHNVFYFLEFRTLDRAQKPSDSKEISVRYREYVLQQAGYQQIPYWLLRYS
jgi:hypothetical protein